MQQTVLDLHDHTLLLLLLAPREKGGTGRVLEDLPNALVRLG